MARQNRIELIKKIQNRRGSKVICYLTSDRQHLVASFAKDIFPVFTEHLDGSGHDKIDLLTFTLGGDTLAAFGLNRLLREYTNHLSAIISDKCHSAGTLFSLGCNQIVMARSATLGPIDPSVNGLLNPVVDINGQKQILPLNVESVAGFKGLVKDEWGIKNGSDLAEILRCFSEKVHPLALRDVYRIREQIAFLAPTLLEQHRGDKDNIRKIVQRLAKELGSHDYLIFRTEAKKLLGKQVLIDEKIEPLVRSLYKVLRMKWNWGSPMTQGV